MSEKSSILAKLKEREQKLKAKIKAAKLAEKKRLAAIHAEKCRAVGAAILAESEENPALLDGLKDVLDKHTKAKRARDMLGLAPLDKDGQGQTGKPSEEK